MKCDGEINLTGEIVLSHHVGWIRKDSVVVIPATNLHGLVAPRGRTRWARGACGPRFVLTQHAAHSALLPVSNTHTVEQDGRAPAYQLGQFNMVKRVFYLLCVALRVERMRNPWDCCGVPTRLRLCHTTHVLTRAQGWAGAGHHHLHAGVPSLLLQAPSAVQQETVRVSGVHGAHLRVQQGSEPVVSVSSGVEAGLAM